MLLMLVMVSNMYNKICWNCWNNGVVLVDVEVFELFDDF